MTSWACRRVGAVAVLAVLFAVALGAAAQEAAAQGAGAQAASVQEATAQGATAPGAPLVAKKASRFVTAAMRAAAVVNAGKYDWARDQRQAAIDAAAPWLALADDDLWAMVTAQELPRSIHTTKGILYEGQHPYCPGCGEEAPAKQGSSWWAVDASAPWKLRCRNCNEVYPKNDFNAFYKSAVDERGMFRKALGDRALLVNAEHPDAQDPLHTLYVDDGYGMFDEKGHRHDIIAHCNFLRWREIQRAVKDLARAYSLTGDAGYAHKAGVLLARVADVYPEMDYAPLHAMGYQHSQGGTGRGRIEGCIWESVVVQDLAYAYDVVFDGIQADAELATFLSAKAMQYKLSDQGSPAAICRHIQDHLLLEGLSAVKDGRIDGNTGMTQCALAAAAIAVDDPTLTREWLDWLSNPGFPGTFTQVHDSVPWVLTEGLDRDGMGGECGGYGLIWVGRMHELVELLAAYPEYPQDFTAKCPKLKQSFVVESRLNVLDAMMPNIGDTGSVGAWGRQGSAATYLQGYELYHDPRFASLATREHTEHGAELRRARDIFLVDPDALIREVESAAKDLPNTLKSDHFGRYGQAYLQTETAEDGRAVFIHYGYAKGHSHDDSLSIGLLAKNVDTMPDLGYPEYTGTWPARLAWTSNTLSHNTLLIGDTRSAEGSGGKIELFAVAPPARVMQVSAPKAYPGVRAYRRMVALVDVGDKDSYVLDIFRARGGTNHRLSWHGSAQQATVAGFEVVPQATGTFAGADVPFACLEGERANSFKQSGFTYLYDVARSQGAVGAPYTVDWRLEDIHGRIGQEQEPHLRLHALTPCDEVAHATGEAPAKRQALRYLIQSRLGDNIESQFVNVLEPFDTKPFIAGVRLLSVTHNGDPTSVAAVAVDLVDGRTDVIISCEQPTRVQVEGDIVFEGTFGLVRRGKDGPIHLRMCGGTLLACPGAELKADRAEWRGKVVRVDTSNPEDNRVVLDPPLPQDTSLVGKTIHFLNDLPMDTSYAIRAVTQDSISTGDITLIRGLADQANPPAGHTYLVNPGDEYVVPTITAWERK